MSDSTEPVLLIERKEHILILTMNRPSVANAVNPELAHAVDDALDMA